MEPHTCFGNLTRSTAKIHTNENALCTSNSKLPPSLRAAMLSGSLAQVAPELAGSSRYNLWGRKIRKC